jgi:RNA polymerase sigma factor (sigma-70 family)
MAQGVLGTVLSHLRRLVSAQAVDGTDAELLSWFIGQRDEKAFEALIYRHGPMVWDVCRNVLQNATDADDAFQATFLVLACKAASIRKHDSVAGWLYGVASRIAARAKTEAARRRARERQAVTMPRLDSDAGAAPEVRSILHQELGCVPEKYRAPMVLFYLEGRSYEETARQLQCPMGTVKSRLARGKEMLRSRLLRRGVALSAGWAVTVLAPCPAAASPTPLIHGAVKAAGRVAAGRSVSAGVISARALALATELLRKAALLRLAVITGILLAAVVAVGAGLMVRRAETEKAAGEKPTRPEPRHDGTEKNGLLRAEQIPATVPFYPTVPRRLSPSGTVVDPNGRPAAGVVVSIFALAIVNDRGQYFTTTTSTDAQGCFAVEKLMSPRLGNVRFMPYHRCDLVIMDKDETRILAWRALTPEALARPLKIAIPSAARIRGKLVDEAGKPVADARITVREMATLGTAGVISSDDQAGTILNVSLSRRAPSTTSDDEGRFEVAGLPGLVRCTLQISSPDFIEQTIFAATTDQSRPSEIIQLGSDQDETVVAKPIYASGFTLVMKRGHSWLGRVLAGDTGQPLPRAVIALGNRYGAQNPARADNQGRCRIGHLPAGTYTALIYDLTDGTDYLGMVTTIEVPSPAGKEESTFRLVRGIPVSGRVVDLDAGKGIPGLEVTHELTSSEPVTKLKARAVRTDAQGRFRIAVPPGKGRVTAFSADSSGKDERVYKDVVVEPGRPVSDIQIRVGQGSVIKGRILDPKGQAVAGTRVGLEWGEKSGFPIWSTVTDPDGQFTFTGLPNLGSYRCSAIDAGRRLGARVEVPLQEDRRKPTVLEIALRPLAEAVGRVVGEDGRPVAHATLRLHFRETGRNGKEQVMDLETEGPGTDADGRFRLDRLIADPSRRYSVEVAAPGYARVRTPEFQALAGRIHSLPEVTLLRASRSVAGRVVDEAGRPVASALVTVKPCGQPRGGGTFAGHPEPTTTNVDGRFQIDGLPPGPVEIQAKAYELEEGTLFRPPILSPKIKVHAGRQDVRITVKRAH